MQAASVRRIMQSLGLLPIRPSEERGPGQERGDPGWGNRWLSVGVGALQGGLSLRRHRSAAACGRTQLDDSQ